MEETRIQTLAELHLIGWDDLGRRWKWLCGLGALLIFLGMIAIGASVLVTLATMVFVGALMMAGGILQTIHAISMRTWSGFFIDLLAGVLYLVVGFAIVAHPGATAIALTLMIVILLIFGGIFRILVALSMNFQTRAWLLLHGVVNLLLGFAIWHDWPVSGLWVIGLVIGIDMVFNGWTLVMLGLAARRLHSLPPGE